MDEKYGIMVQADSDGELFLEFPDELLEALDLQIGDTLVWEKSDNEIWSFKKGNKNEG